MRDYMIQVLEQSGCHKDHCCFLHQKLELSNYSSQHHSRWQHRQKLHQEIHSLRRKGFCPCMSCWRRLCGCPEILAMSFFHHSNHLQFSPSITTINANENYIKSNENSSKTTVVSQSSLSFLVKQWLVEKSLSCSVRQLVQGSVPLIPCHVQGGYYREKRHEARSRGTRIWARQIWSSGVSLKRSCKMHFRSDALSLCSQ